MEEAITNNLDDKMNFLQGFMEGNKADQNIAIANQQDKIIKLTATIKKIEADQSKQYDTIKACKAILDSKAYPQFELIISSYSDGLKRSAESKNKKIKKIKKQIRRAKRKIKKIQRKQKRTDLLKNYFDVLQSPKTGQSEYIAAIRAIKEDSLIRTENQLEKTKSRIAKTVMEYESNGLSSAKRVKLGAKIRKMQSKRDMLIGKLTNLNELDSELNKLAKIELVDDKINELKTTSVETAEKAAMDNSSISDMIDNQTDIITESIERIVEPETVSNESKDIKSQPEEKVENPTEKEIVTQSNTKMTLRNFTPSEAAKMMEAGIEFSVVKRKDGSFTAVFNNVNIKYG